MPKTKVIVLVNLEKVVKIEEYTESVNAITNNKWIRDKFLKEKVFKIRF